jgi:hypothetical protein
MILPMNIPLTLYVLRAGIKDRLILSCLALTILTVCLSLFVGDAAIVEKSQFVVVYAAGGLRVLSVLAITLFTAFYIQRSFAGRDVEYLLSRPISRPVFLLSHAAALKIIALGLSIVAGVAVSLLSYNNLGTAQFLWTFSLFCEVMMMAFVTLFFGMVLSSATTCTLAALAFYTLARMTGQLLGIIQEHGVTWGGWFLSPITQGISMVIPRFDLMTQSSWLIYGPQGAEGLLFLVAQTAVFSLLVLAAAVVDLVRRQF